MLVTLNLTRRLSSTEPALKDSAAAVGVSEAWDMAAFSQH